MDSITGCCEDERAEKKASRNHIARTHLRQHVPTTLCLNKPIKKNTIEWIRDVLHLQYISLFQGFCENLEFSIEFHRANRIERARNILLVPKAIQKATAECNWRNHEAARTWEPQPFAGVINSNETKSFKPRDIKMDPKGHDHQPINESRTFGL